MWWFEKAVLVTAILVQSLDAEDTNLHVVAGADLLSDNDGPAGEALSMVNSDASEFGMDLGDTVEDTGDLMSNDETEEYGNDDISEEAPELELGDAAEEDADLFTDTLELGDSESIDEEEMESDAADSGLELGDAATDELDSIPTVQNKGKDCWYKCGRKSGDCKFCGSRGACCRKGWKNAACDQATAPTKHHMCVYSKTHEVLNKGKDCWYKCGRKSGDCKFCGSRGACCRKGWKNAACDQATAPTKHHMCVYSNTYSIKSRSASATTVKNVGKWCWKQCNKKRGKCSFCGTGGACCRKGKKAAGCDSTKGSSTHSRCAAAVYVKPTVRTAATVLNKGKWCFHQCGGNKIKRGKCSFCGTGGACCRKGYDNQYCDGSKGSSTHSHCTAIKKPVKKDVKNVGKNCYTACKRKRGKCSFCGKDGACCRKGYRYKTGPCDGKTGDRYWSRCMAV